MGRLTASCGGQDTRQGWGWLTAEHSGALGQQSQQRRPGCRKGKETGRETERLRRTGP